MKKFIVLFVLVIFSIPTDAIRSQNYQLQQGLNMIGASLNEQRQKEQQSEYGEELESPWLGYDRDNDCYIGIGEGNLVRKLKIIEIYDYGDAKYHLIQVGSIERIGDIILLTVHDPTFGGQRTFEMGDREDIQ